MLEGTVPWPDDLARQYAKAGWWRGRDLGAEIAAVAAARPDATALVDGGTRLQAFRHVLLPLASTGVLAAGVIVFAFDWAEFLFAFILTATPQSMTFPVGVQGLVTQFEIIWNDMAAGGVIAILIPLVMMLLARRYVLTGLTFGVIREK